MNCNNFSTASSLRQTIRECYAVLNIATSSPVTTTQQQDYRLIFRGKELTEDYNSNLLAGLGIEEGVVAHCCPRMNTVTKKDEENTIISFEEKMQDNEPPMHVAIQELIKTENTSKLFSIFQTSSSDLWCYIPMCGIYHNCLHTRIPKRI